jgi:alkaline phosphatase
MNVFPVRLLPALLFPVLILLVSCAGKSGNALDSAKTAFAGKPKNIILFIGDGMGPTQVALAAAQKFGQERDAQGNPSKLSFETFPAFGYLTTFSANSFVTDSAAAGTALACGQKTENGAIGVLPDNTPIRNVADIAKDRGKAVGVMSSVGLNHATPAAFYAHVKERGGYDLILDQFFEQAKIDVLIGGGYFAEKWDDAKIQEAASAKGYKVFTCETVATMTPDVVGDSKVFGYFDTNKNRMLDAEASRAADNVEPHLSDLTVQALQILTRKPGGFFLMVEGGAIDWTCHGNNAKEAIGETLEFDRAIQRTLDYLKARGELDSTLIIVTADHETGGLGINGPYKKTLAAGEEPETGWTTKGHTALPVNVWASGPGSKGFIGKNDNTYVHRAIVAAME